MVKLKRMTEQVSSLASKCKETIKAELGVIPFPLGESSLILKAVYFHFTIGQPELAVGEDVLLDIDENAVTVSINKSCTPNGKLSVAFVEELNPQYPLMKALPNICKKIAVETNRTGQSWCRVGNYKTLVIASPFVDRLKAFFELNPTVRIPGVAAAQIDRVPKGSPDYQKAYKALSDNSLTPAEVKDINKKMQEFIDTFGATIKPTEIPAEDKPMSDRKRKNQLNKLISQGIGSGKDKPKSKNPRLLSK